jgi:hypothetical protein
MAGRIEPPPEDEKGNIDSLLFWRLLAPWRFKFSRLG